jgi:phosphohistidine swiveling domain-containing protein
MIINIDPKKENFRWGPIPGKFIFISHFTSVVHSLYFYKNYGERWPEALLLFKSGKMIWINEYPVLRKRGKKLFKNWILNPKKRKQVYTEWQKALKRLLFIEKKIDSLNLKKLTDQELLKTWQELNQGYINFWIPGIIPEFGNYGADYWLKQRVKKYVKSEQELNNVLEILTVPTKPSFYQQEKIDLCQTKSLKEHQRKYFWLQNSYAGAKFLNLSYFRKRRAQIKNLKEEIENIKHNLAQARIRKNNLVKKLKIDLLTIKIAKGISQCMSWQDQRKKYIFIATYYLYLLINEIGKRFGYSYFDLEYLWPKEIEQIIKGKNYKITINQRKKGFGVYISKKIRNLTPKEAKKYWKVFQEKLTFKNKKIKIIKGLGVSKGKALGMVRIVPDPFKTNEFKKGEILVAAMTSPEYIFAMQKAKAVITDAGGFTCHAAIVSRELKIPCIVGTKIATKVLKDGQLVEVDADKGVVRIIK